MIENQALVWLGAMYAPLLPAFGLIANVIAFYFKLMLAVWLHSPPITRYSASRTSNLAYGLMLRKPSTPSHCLAMPCLFCSSTSCLTCMNAEKAMFVLLSCSDSGLHHCAIGVRLASHSPEVWPPPGHQHEVSPGQRSAGTKVSTTPNPLPFPRSPLS